MTRDSIFLDWFSVGQRFPLSRFDAETGQVVDTLLPEVNGGVKVDGEAVDYVLDGEQTWAVVKSSKDRVYGVKSARAEGSHSTAVRVRSHNNDVRLPPEKRFKHWKRLDQIGAFG